MYWRSTHAKSRTISPNEISKKLNQSCEPHFVLRDVYQRKIALLPRSGESSLTALHTMTGAFVDSGNPESRPAFMVIIPVLPLFLFLSQPSPKNPFLALPLRLLSSCAWSCHLDSASQKPPKPVKVRPCFRYYIRVPKQKENSRQMCGKYVCMLPGKFLEFKHNLFLG